MKFYLVIMVGLNMWTGPERPFEFMTGEDCNRAANVASFMYQGNEKMTATCYDQNGKFVSMYGRG